ARASSPRARWRCQRGDSPRRSRGRDDARPSRRTRPMRNKSSFEPERRCRAPCGKYSCPRGTKRQAEKASRRSREEFISTVEARILERIEAVFVRCPELFRFSVRDRSGLPDHIDPTRLEGELFIFEIALAPRLGKAQYDEVYGAISAAITAAVSSWPEAKNLLRGRTFVRYLH